jgi:hypothetical protein
MVWGGVEFLFWVGRKMSLCVSGRPQLFCFDLGSVGDLRRATSGEGETEPKQIVDGTQVETER